MSAAPNLAEALRLALLANTDLIALGISSANVWDSFAPAQLDPAGPWIVLTPVSQEETASQDGDDALEGTRYQLTIGGTDGVLLGKVQRTIARQFNGLDYPYVEDTVTYLVHFFHRGGNETPWEPDTATYKLSVDLELWVQT